MTDFRDFDTAYAAATAEVETGSPSEWALDIWSMSMTPEWRRTSESRVSSDCGLYAIEENLETRTYTVKYHGIVLETVDFLDEAERVATRHKARRELVSLG